MNPHYNQNYSKEQVTKILQKIKECVTENRFTVAKNEHREENIAFINEYNITSKKQHDILLQIEPEDFCHSLQNVNLGFEHEVLYVFVPQVKLFNFVGEENLIDIYTKFNIIDMANGRRVVVISLHECNKPIDYTFR